MLERRPKSQPDRRRLDNTSDARQRRRLSIAIVLLLIALAVMLIKDRRFWLGSGGAPPADAEMRDTVPPASEHTSVAPVVPAPPPIVAAKSKPHKKHTAPKPDVVGLAVATKHIVSPPLPFEVVTGEAFRRLYPGNDGLKVEIKSGSTPGFPKYVSERAALSTVQVSHALGRVEMSAEITQSSAEAVGRSNPVLAKQMRVQGSVVLQAIIGSDGVIQDLRVLSGPAILASAAREAVRQWRFKPYLQDGQPIETLAKIIVNFVIST